MDVSILRWRAVGLRCPDAEVSLVDGAGRPAAVTFVQMPNGTGKTTTLALLRAALSGSADDWTEEKVRSFQKTRDDAPTQGRFLLDLDVNGSRLTLELNFDFDLGRAGYRTSSIALGGLSPGFAPPASLARFLRPEFVDLFIFDAEEAANLLSRERTRARHAIDELFQISTLRGMERAFYEHWERHAESVSATELKGYNRRKNTRDKLRDRRNEIRREREQVIRKLRSLEEELSDRQHKFDEAMRQDEATGRRLDQLRDAVNATSAEVNRLNYVAIRLSRDPYRVVPIFGEQLIQLKSHLDRLKLPTSTSREFFDELLEEDDCICGRPLDDDVKSVIQARAEEFLDDDEVGVLNTIKSDIASFIAGDPVELAMELDVVLEDLNDAVYKHEEAVRELRLAEDSRVREGGSELQDLRAAAEKAGEELRRLQERLADIDAPYRGDPGTDTSSLKTLEVLLEEAEYRLAEVTNTIELKRKTEVVQGILATATDRARTALSDELLTATNKVIEGLLKREPVRLSAIRDHLVLEGQDEASVGQTLSVGYAFLSTLFGHGGYRFPFVVDSPAGPLDLANRPPVARLIPKLCHQFVCFIISSERARFVEPLEAETNGSVRFLTLFRKTPATADLVRSATGTVVETGDGVAVDGAEFFAGFDIEEEEDENDGG